MDIERAWDEYVATVSELETLGSIEGLLAWDQQVNLPVGGGANRARQAALISRTRHLRLTDPRLGELLEILSEAELGPVQSASVRVMNRQYRRATRVSAELVAAFTHAQAEGFQQWISARQHADFSLFAPSLKRLLELTIEQAQAIDSTRSVYDVQLDIFDPGTNTAALREMFESLHQGLLPLLDAIQGQTPIEQHGTIFSVEGQRSLNLAVVEAFGLDLSSGRLDYSEHPFTVGLGQGDVRITTRLDTHSLMAGLSATMHETGHALYEQGLPRATWQGTGLAQAASLGLHESQSRFWENYIGRSRAFMEWLGSIAPVHLGSKAPDADLLFQMANRVHAGAIRIHADEVSYNLHIIARFELELGMMSGDIEVDSLPEAWNEKYRKMLGVQPHGVTAGLLQDVHWAHGMFGYFPSYTLGNLYAASLASKLKEEMPTHMESVQKGEFSDILIWLREQIHSHGRLMEAPELMRSVVGEGYSVEHLLDHLWDRHGGLYGVQRPASD